MSVKRDESAKVNSVNRRGAFIALAKELEIDPCELVVKTVKEQDSIQGAATKLGMNPNTIRYWLARAGKEIKHRRKLVLVDTEA